jgi:hypothetical protein
MHIQKKSGVIFALLQEIRGHCKASAETETGHYYPVRRVSTIPATSVIQNSIGEDMLILLILHMEAIPVLLMHNQWTTPCALENQNQLLEEARV